MAESASSRRLLTPREVAGMSEPTTSGAHPLIGSGIGAVLNSIAKQSATDYSTCQHCGEAIFLAPFFLDGKLPNPPVWQHDGGTQTCRTEPKGWRGSWPMAAPLEAEGAV